MSRVKPEVQSRRAFSQRTSSIDLLSPDIYFVPPNYNAYVTPQNRLYQAARKDVAIVPSHLIAIPRITTGMGIRILEVPKPSVRTRPLPDDAWLQMEHDYYAKRTYCEPPNLGNNEYNPNNFYHV